MKQTLFNFLFSVILLNGFNCQSQNSNIFQCQTTEYGFCGGYISIYTDSIFLCAQGCERHQSIQIGKMDSTHKNTVYLKKFDLVFDQFYDSIVFISGKIPADTIDLFYYDKSGKGSYSENNALNLLDTAIYWANTPELNYYDVTRFSDIIEIDRGFEYYGEYYKGLPENHPLYNVGNTYIINSKQSLGLLLVDYYNWTGERKVLEIPANTTRINVYYALPKDLISLLQIFMIRLDHQEGMKIYKCGEMNYRIE